MQIALGFQRFEALLLAALNVAELENCIVIIKHVPCLKCSQCGEVVYTGTTLQKIEQILEKCKAAMTEVAIVEYQPAA